MSNNSLYYRTTTQNRLRGDSQFDPLRSYGYFSLVAGLFVLDIDQLEIKEKIYKELFKYQTLVKSGFGQQGSKLVQLPNIDVKAKACT